LLVRPWNRAVHSPLYRSLSPHTSVRGLIDLLQTPALRNNVMENLTARINAKKITIKELYLLGHTVVGAVITETNIEPIAGILSRAERGGFLFKFEAVGKLSDGRTYGEFRAAPVYYYNLPFFSGLSFSTRSNIWGRLVSRIDELNPDLGRVLIDIHAERVRIETALIKAYPLPLKPASDASVSEPSSRVHNGSSEITRRG
jgi:hypothetical protein